MVKEFRIALIVSTSIHLGGFGLLFRGNHPFFQNGLGETSNNVVVFEIGWLQKKPVPVEKGEGEKKGAWHHFSGDSGYARENSGGMNNEYLLEVRRCIERARFYPREARRRLITGGVTVGFYIGSDGSARDISIIRPSGYSILDNTALEIVSRANPFPKPPDGGNIYVRTTIVFTDNILKHSDN